MPSDKYNKVQQEGERLENLIDNIGSAPVGLDVGTSKIVAARPKGRDGTETAGQLNAFIPVPWSKFTQRTLDQNGVAYFRSDDGSELLIYGNDTEKFANMFNVNARRPMADGLLNPRERAAMKVLDAIITRLVPRAGVQGEVLAFSAPASAEGKNAELTFHEETLRRHFEGMGYRAIAINEGLAVVFAELHEQNYTGIGISCGGGMCNVALAYLSVPSIMFSIPKGGDYIDASAATVVNEQHTRVKVLKEEELDLSREPRSSLERALHIYYEDLVETLVETLMRKITAAEKLPKPDAPIPIVLAGGTAKPKGFRDMFEKSLQSRRPLPIAMGPVKMSPDPLTATARGALIAAQYEK